MPRFCKASDFTAKLIWLNDFLLINHRFELCEVGGGRVGVGGCGGVAVEFLPCNRRVVGLNLTVATT